MHSDSSPRHFLGRGTAARGLTRFASVASILLLAIPAATIAADAVTARADSEAAYAGKLTDLAKWCDGQHLTAEARISRDWLPRREPDKLYFFILPDSLSPAADSSNPAVGQWWQRFVKLRQAQADALFDLAEKARWPIISRRWLTSWSARRCARIPIMPAAGPFWATKNARGCGCRPTPPAA